MQLDYFKPICICSLFRSLLKKESREYTTTLLQTLLFELYRLYNLTIINLDFVLKYKVLLHACRSSRLDTVNIY